MVEEGRRSGCHKHTRQAPDIPTRVKKSQTKSESILARHKVEMRSSRDKGECALARGRDSLGW